MDYIIYACIKNNYILCTLILYIILLAFDLSFIYGLNTLIGTTFLPRIQFHIFPIYWYDCHNSSRIPI